MGKKYKDYLVGIIIGAILGAIVLMFTLVRFGPFSVSKYLAEVNVIKVPGVSTARAVGNVELDGVEIKIEVIDKPNSLVKSKTNILNFLKKKGITKAEIDHVSSNIWRVFDNGKMILKKITEILIRTTDLKKAETLESSLIRLSSEDTSFSFCCRRFKSVEEVIGSTGGSSMLDEAIEDARKKAIAILKPTGKQVTEVAAAGAVSENLPKKHPEDIQKIRLKAEVHFYYK